MNFTNWLQLNEGLIKVPEKMVEQAMKFVVQEIITYLDKKVMRGKKKQYPDHNKFFKIIQNHYGVKPQSNFYTWTELDIDLDDLPEPIQQAFESKRPVLDLIIDWKGDFMKNDEVKAWYVERDDRAILITNPRDIQRYLRTDPTDIEYFLEEMRASIIHELTHFIQFRAIKNIDPKQTAIKKGYDDTNKRNYYSSPAEFDPHIKSAIWDFQNSWRVAASMGKDLDKNRSIEIFTGARVVDWMYRGFVQPSHFFLSLKRTSPRRWKKAVKLFYQNMGYGNFYQDNLWKQI